MYDCVKQSTGVGAKAARDQVWCTFWGAAGPSLGTELAFSPLAQVSLGTSGTLKTPLLKQY